MFVLLGVAKYALATALNTFLARPEVGRDEASACSGQLAAGRKKYHVDRIISACHELSAGRCQLHADSMPYAPCSMLRSPGYFILIVLSLAPYAQFV